MPPPRVSPPTPTEAVSPELMPRPCSARARATSPHRAPPPMRTSAPPSGSATTSTVSSAVRSMSTPLSSVHQALCPPARTTTSWRPAAVKRAASLTSSTEPTRTMMSGRPRPACETRAASHPWSSALRTDPDTASRSGAMSIPGTLSPPADTGENRLSPTHPAGPRHPGPGTSVRGALQPAAALEEEVERDARRDHEPERHRVAPGPGELGHEVEVHAVDRADQGRREEDRRPRRHLLDLVVLRDAEFRHAAHRLAVGLLHERRVHPEGRPERVPEGVDPVGQVADGVLDVVERGRDRRLRRSGDDLLDAFEHVGQRRRRVLHVDDLALQLEDAARDPLVSREELLLDLVDVVLHALEHGTVGSEEVLEHRPEHGEGSLGEDLRIGVELAAHELVIDPVVAVDGQDEVGADEQVDLGALDRLAVVEVARGLQDDERHR